MSESNPAPLFRHSFDAADLMARFPPQWVHPNKQVVYDIACPAGSLVRGTIGVSRWAAMPLPATLPDALPILESRVDVFGYEAVPANANRVEWYLNFAHHDLFCAYGGPLFAQDEIQVAEHPALGSVREALFHLPLGEHVEPLTVEHGEPTPVLVTGVERRCAIATDRNEREGRPLGLYGNQFAAADPDVVRQATYRINPPTTTNIIAIEAPAYGFEKYSREELHYILRTATTGFRAAKLESARLAGNPAVVIHTGFWGCGAYGGNRVLMALMQQIAAQMAGIDRLVFHTFDESGAHAFATAQVIFDNEITVGTAPITTTDVLTMVHGMGFEWGMSDGT